MTQKHLPRSTPEENGIASSAVLKFVERVEREIDELHSFMLLRHGAVVAEGWWAPYAPQKPHMLFSLSKSFTSSAVGLAVADGLLRVEDPVISFFPDDLPAKVSKYLAAMRVKDLLTMTTGHAKDATRRTVTQKEGNWIKGFLSLGVRYKPGTHFVYNSAATYMLSAIVQKLTGKTVLEYLTPRLFEPLGIENPKWDTCPRGINVGGWGLNIRTEDIARFGQLYLQKGNWNGNQILPSAWVAEATSRQVPNGDQPDSDWAQGYGYQFWRCRHNIYRGDGAFGQYCIVMPDQDAVLAITSGVRNMQDVLNVVWEELLPSMAPQALPANENARAQLGKKLGELALTPLHGERISPGAARFSAKWYQIAKNRLGIKAFCLEFNNDHCVIETQTAKGQVSLDCGYGEWRQGEGPFLERGIQQALTSGVWTGENTFKVTVRLVETPFYQTLNFQFTEDMLNVSVWYNVGFGPSEVVELAGRLAS